MPYIDPPRRRDFDRALDKLNWPYVAPGDLTYLIYRALLLFVQKGGEANYERLSRAIACATDAAAEMRRQHLDPLEDRKRFERGDVEV